jgi:hypothetical protein
MAGFDDSFALVGVNAPGFGLATMLKRNCQTLDCVH